MAFYQWRRMKNSSGFILPLTLTSLLILSIIVLNHLERLQINLTSLKEEQSILKSFLAFQSAKAELLPILDQSQLSQGSGELSEDSNVIAYMFKSLSDAQYQINLSQKTPSGSTNTVWFVYNKDTKKIEKWVTQ